MARRVFYHCVTTAGWVLLTKNNFAIVYLLAPAAAA
jgi:hypothetical protein